MRQRGDRPEVEPLQPTEGQSIGDVVADLVGGNEEQLRLDRMPGAEGRDLGEVVWEHLGPKGEERHPPWLRRSYGGQADDGG